MLIGASSLRWVMGGQRPIVQRRVAAECQSLPPLAWLGDSRRTRRRRPRRRPRRLHRAAGSIWPRCRRRRRVERPRNPEHGDYASDARAAARQEGRRAARASSPRRSPSSSARSPGIKSVEIAGPGFLNIRLDAAAAGRAGPHGGRRRARRTGTATRSPGSGSTWSSSPPTRPGRCTSAASAGRRSATRWRRLLRAAGAEVATRVLLQRRRRRRSTGSPGRCCAAAQGRAGAGGRLRRRVHRRDRRRGRRRATRRARPPDDEALEMFRVEGVELMFDGDQAVARPSSACTSTSTSTRRTCTTRASSTPALSRLREQGHVFEADGAVWLRTTDFGDDKDRVLRQEPTASGPTSPPTAPTTSTSASAASTGASIMLGADHHGYVGRLQAIAAVLRRRPGRQPRDPDRPDGQPGHATASRCG